MSKYKCPGQNTQFWGPADIFDINCSGCHGVVEFFKDDPQRKCPECGQMVFNPRVDLGCALWCPQADECIGPERYNSLVDTAKRTEKRKQDMQRLLASIKPEDKDIRDLFKKLYLENKDNRRLIDPDRLKEVRGNNPNLFRRATEYFSRFNKEEKKS